MRDALLVLQTYSHLITDALRFELQVDGSTATLAWSDPPLSSPGAFAAAEFIVAHIVRAVINATRGRWRPTQIAFRHVAPARRLPEYLGVVRFGASVARLEFAEAMLDVPIAIGAGLPDIFVGRDSPATDEQVRSAVALALAAGAPVSIAAIARQLGLTARTLQRRLRGVARFQELLDDARRDLALSLVRARPDLPIKEIAYRVGFSSTRGFTRAFARWTGTPPTRARQSP